MHITAHAMSAQKLFLLQFWGGNKAKARATVPPSAEVREHRGVVCLWFSTVEERDAFDQVLAKFHNVVTSTYDGPSSRLRTVARYTLKKDGRSYDLETDFGFGYEPDSAEWMFREGNYACDDNRSLFIQAVDPTFPEHGCGGTIALTRFEVARLPG